MSPAEGGAAPIDNAPTMPEREAPVRTAPATQLERPAPATLPERPAPREDGPSTVPERPSAKPRPEAATEPRREAMGPSRERLARALTGLVVCALGAALVWGMARPSALLAPPALSAGQASGALPDCGRIRFPLSVVLGARWRPLTLSCLRGDCEGLRGALVEQGFPASSWRLVSPGEDPEGCLSQAGQRPSGEACARLASLVEGGAEEVLLQAEGECQEAP